MGKKDKKRRFGGARANAEQRSSGSGFGYIKLPKDFKFFSPENECVVTLDIFPYEVTNKHHLDKIEKGDYWYKAPFKVHRKIGPTKDAYVCPTSYGKSCSICDRIEDLRNEDTKDNAKEIDALKLSLRNLYVVKVREYEGTKKKFDKKAFHLFDISDYCFQDVFETQLKKKEEFDDFFDPENGCSLEITFDATTFGSSKPFPKATRVDFIKRKKQYDEDIVDDIPKLDDLLTVLSYEELEDLYHGAPADDDEQEEKKSKKKKDKKKDKEDTESEEKTSKKDKDKKKDKKSGKKKDKKKEETKKDECPYGYKFGKDVDKKDECEDCEVWNECKAAKKAKKKGKK